MSPAITVGMAHGAPLTLAEYRMHHSHPAASRHSKATRTQRMPMELWMDR